MLCEVGGDPSVSANYTDWHDSGIDGCNMAAVYLLSLTSPFRVGGQPSRPPLDVPHTPPAPRCREFMSRYRFIFTKLAVFDLCFPFYRFLYFYTFVKYSINVKKRKNTRAFTQQRISSLVFQHFRYFNEQLNF